MKTVLLLLIASVAAAQSSVAWSAKSPTAIWPLNGGFENSMGLYDFQSGLIISRVKRSFAGTVSMSNGSQTVTWVGGDKFGVVWHAPHGTASGSITIGSVNTVQLAAGTTPSGCTAGVAISCTQFTMASPWSGSSGTYAYTAVSNAIYSDAWGLYNPNNNTYAWGPGWGSLDNQCLTDSATYGLPDARQAGSWAIDTTRHLLFGGGGVNDGCEVSIVSSTSCTLTAVSGQYFTQAGLWTGLTAIPQGGSQSGLSYTIASVNSELSMTLNAGSNPCPTGATSVWIEPPERFGAAGQNSLLDWGYLTLNANPALDTWTQLPAATVTAIFRTNNANWNETSATYDPDDDGVILYGNTFGHNTFVFCSTIGNPGGTLTALQTGMGCTGSGNAFDQVTGLSAHAPGIYFPALFYDSVNHVARAFGGSTTYSSGHIQTDVWTYTPRGTQAWSAQSSTSQPTMTAIYDEYPEAVLIPATGNIFLHVPDTPADYTWNESTNAWSQITTTGASIPECVSGSGNACTTGVGTVFYPPTYQVIAISQGNVGSPSGMYLWQAQLPGGPAAGLFPLPSAIQ